MRLAFWNSGVAPARTKVSLEKRRARLAQAAELVAQTFADGVDILALCEVDIEAVAEINARVAEPGITALAECGPIGRSRWDFGVFYRCGQLLCEPEGQIVGMLRANHVRAAFRFRVVAPRLAFQLFLLHWRSQLRGGSDDHRQRAAETLREAYQAELRDGSKVVVLGDFNAEPFDPCFVALDISRDPRTALRFPSRFLFNPSWSLVAPCRGDAWGPYGTIGHAGERRVFDQALTSSGFLNPETGQAPHVRLLTVQPGLDLQHAAIELQVPS